MLTLCIIACDVIHFRSYHFMYQSWHDTHSYPHSCILVTEPSESESVEPAGNVELEPGVEFVAAPEENQGKQLSMTPCT